MKIFVQWVDKTINQKNQYMLDSGTQYTNHSIVIYLVESVSHVLYN